MPIALLKKGVASRRRKRRSPHPLVTYFLTGCAVLLAAIVMVAYQSETPKHPLDTALAALEVECSPRSLKRFQDACFSLRSAYTHPVSRLSADDRSRFKQLDDTLRHAELIWKSRDELAGLGLTFGIASNKKIRAALNAISDDDRRAAAYLNGEDKAEPRFDPNLALDSLLEEAFEQVVSWRAATVSGSGR